MNATLWHLGILLEDKQHPTLFSLYILEDMFESIQYVSKLASKFQNYEL